MNTVENPMSASVKVKASHALDEGGRQNDTHWSKFLFLPFAIAIPGVELFSLTTPASQWYDMDTQGGYLNPLLEAHI